MDIKFFNTFIDINFDEILSNNHLINSNELYLQYKTNYLTTTNNNFILYNDLIENLNNLSSVEYQNNDFLNNTKYHYTFIDKTEINILKQNIKILIITQKKLLSNFLHYLDTLNENKDNYFIEQL